jgi:hypothetical protein
MTDNHEQHQIVNLISHHKDILFFNMIQTTKIGFF